MPGHIGQSLLEDSKNRRGLLAIRDNIVLTPVQPALGSGACFKFLGRPFQGGNQSQVVEHARPQFGRQPAHEPNRPVNHLQDRLGPPLPHSLTVVALVRRQIIDYRGDVQLDSGQSLAQAIVDFARHPGPLLFPRALEARGQCPQLLQRMLQFLFRLLDLGYVHHRADELNRIAGFVYNRVADNVALLDRTLRQNDSIIADEVSSLTDGAFENLLDLTPIFRVNSSVSRLERYRLLLRIKPKNAVKFRRPEDDLSRRHLNGPTADVTESLRFGEVSLAPPQLLLRLLSGRDVFHDRHGKLRRRFGARRQRNGDPHPDQTAVLAPVAFLVLVLRPFTLPQLLGQCLVGLTVLFVCDVQKRQRPQLFIRVPQHFLVGKIGRGIDSIGTRERNPDRRVFEDRAPSFFAGPQCLLRPLAPTPL